MVFLRHAKGVKKTTKKESTSCRSKLKCFVKYLNLRRENQKKNELSQPISRVLSWTVIHLGSASLLTSSDLPGSSASHTDGSLFGLAPNGVCRATNCYQSCGALLPHPFTLTFSAPKRMNWRSTLCCTFRGLSPPRRYLAFCSMEPGLSSTRCL